MCQRVACKNCGKATYRGCGMHVDQVLFGLPASQRCTCEADKADKADKAGQAGKTGSGGGWFARVLGSRRG